MYPLLCLIIFLSLHPLFAQLQKPVIRSPVDIHPNTTLQNPELPPAPNPPNPYDPFGTRENYNRARDDRLSPSFTDANAAAIHFINIIDNQVYSAAWLDAGGVMHDVVPQKMWAEGMRATRMHLGIARTRKYLSHQTRKALSGGLVGEFMIIRYATQFANRPNSVETVTLMMHAPLGLWKVVSYSID